MRTAHRPHVARRRSERGRVVLRLSTRVLADSGPRLAVGLGPCAHLVSCPPGFCAYTRAPNRRRRRAARRLTRLHAGNDAGPHAGSRADGRLGARRAGGAAGGDRAQGRGRRGQGRRRGLRLLVHRRRRVRARRPLRLRPHELRRKVPGHGAVVPRGRAQARPHVHARVDRHGRAVVRPRAGRAVPGLLHRLGGARPARRVGSLGQILLFVGLFETLAGIPRR